MSELCTTCISQKTGTNTGRDISLQDKLQVCLLSFQTEIISTDGISIFEKMEGRKMFYSTTHSTHFVYGYMASDIGKEPFRQRERKPAAAI